jgi:DNA-binding response OmpR family regulator
MEKILVVEDEPALLDTLAYNLRRQNFEVLIAKHGSSAVALAQEQNPDLIILDLMLPIIDGLEVCRIVRKTMNMPIIMLTARGEEIDRVVGLEMGADDYITKPFSMRELIARVKAQLRRVRLTREEGEANESEPVEMIRSGNLALDLNRREASIDHTVLQLKPQEYDLLLYLMRHKGRALARELILEQVWGWEFSGGSRTVDVHIRWLREKIEEKPAEPKRIVTVYGIGYRFEE